MHVLGYWFQGLVCPKFDCWIWLLDIIYLVFRGRLAWMIWKIMLKWLPEEMMQRSTSQSKTILSNRKSIRTECICFQWSSGSSCAKEKAGVPKHEFISSAQIGIRIFWACLHMRKRPHPTHHPANGTLHISWIRILAACNRERECKKTTITTADEGR